MLDEDPKSHQVEAEPLQAARQGPAARLMAIDLSDGSTITATLAHAFRVDAGPELARAGWFYAEHLRVGDQLRTANGKHVAVVGLRYNAGRADVYTLTVAHDHTFFVGAARVLVHNAVGDCLTVPVRVITGNRRAGLVHIILRHLSGSRVARLLTERGITRTRGASQFAVSTAEELRNLLIEAVNTGTPFVEDARGGYVAEIDLGRPIGANQLGTSTSVIRIIANAAGEIISAYPI